MEKHERVQIHWTKSSVLGRGWTEGGIKKFLGDPDAEKTNPHYKCAAPMKLYLIERVEAAEQTPEFSVWKETASKRNCNAQKAVETKRRKLLGDVENFEVEVEVDDFNVVRGDAIESYNDFDFERGQFAKISDDVEFLNRITVNYVRHELTNYDHHLYSIIGKVGKQDAYILITKKIFDAIGKAYPMLAGECQRQLSRKGCL